MSVKAASEGKLGELHDKLADLFIVAVDGMIETSTVDPPTLNAARAFLKDNDIVCVPSADNRVGSLEGKLSALRKDGKERFKDAGNVTPLRVNES